MDTPLKPVLLRGPNNIYKMFYLDINDHLNIKSVDDKNAKPYKLSDDKITDYDVDIDANGNIHTIYADNLGNIVYYIYSEGKWSRSMLSKFDLTKQQVIKIRFKMISRYIHIIYAIKSNKSHTVLVHYRWDGKEWKYNTLTQINGGMIHINMVCDNHGSLYVVYDNQTDDQRSTNYIELHANVNKWTYPIVLNHSVTADNSDMFIDKNDIKHFIYQNTDGIFYRRKQLGGWPKNVWSEPISLSPYGSSDSNPVIILIKATLWILWKQNNDIFCCMSSDNGFTWTNPFKFDSIGNNNVALSKFVDKSGESFSSNNLYISCKDAFKIIFVDEIINNTDVNYFSFYIKEMQNYAENITTSAKRLSNEIIELKGKVNKLKAEKAYADNALENQNIEITGIKNKYGQLSDLYQASENKIHILEKENNELKKLLNELNTQLSQNEKHDNKNLINKVMTFFK